MKTPAVARLAILFIPTQAMASLFPPEGSTIGETAQYTGTLQAQQVAGTATHEAQRWLQSFGTSRIDVLTDKDFRVRGGSFDLLVPLTESEQRVFFTQAGIREKDGQITGNIGLGQRHFVSDWMLGYNAFYDQSFNWGHRRIGLGAEAWRDNLKLSGNHYHRLSDWKTSGDVDGYEARPANGFDLRAEAFLPDYPQLGGRLMYEKYYGNEVALFGGDKRQKDPAAMTAGLSFTPVPLISLSADHKKSGGLSENQLGMHLTYYPGLSLSEHFSPSRVAERRTLAGSARDLVERNHNIVLDYRKQQAITFTLAKNIVGQGRSTLDIPYTFSSEYSLSKINWQDEALTAAGGRINGLGGGKYALTLPPYSAQGSNTYSLSGVAIDTQNKASPLATTWVTVKNSGESLVTENLETDPALLTYTCWGANPRDPRLDIEEASNTAARYKYTEITGVPFRQVTCALKG